MGIPNIHSASTPTSPLITSSAPAQDAPSLLIGELNIEGRSYTVSIESPELLLPSPTDDTIKETKEKIEYLVKLHLERIQSEGINLNDVIIEQLDEDGLAYSTKEDNNWKQKTLSSSTIDFDPSNPSDPSNPFSSALSLPSSLQNLGLTSIREVFRSIIDPLIAKKNEPKKETPPPIPPGPTMNKKISRLPRVIFAQHPEDGTPMNPPKNHTPKIENRRGEECLHTIPKEVDDGQSNTADQQNIPKESNTWGDRFKSWTPSFLLFRSKSFEVVDPSKIVGARTESFLQEHPEVPGRFREIDLQ